MAPPRQRRLLANNNPHANSSLHASNSLFASRAVEAAVAAAVEKGDVEAEVEAEDLLVVELELEQFLIVVIQVLIIKHMNTTMVEVI